MLKSSAICRGVEAGSWETWSTISDDMSFGRRAVLLVNLKMDQDLFGWSAKAESREPKYLARHSRIIRFALVRSWRNFSFWWLEGDFFSFRRAVSFFRRTWIISLVIQGGWIFPSSDFVGMWSATADRKVFFHRSQSSLILLWSWMRLHRSVDFSVFRRPSKSPLR